MSLPISTGGLLCGAPPLSMSTGGLLCAGEGELVAQRDPVVVARDFDPLVAGGVRAPIVAGGET